MFDSPRNCLYLSVSLLAFLKPRVYPCFSCVSLPTRFIAPQPPSRPPHDIVFRPAPPILFPKQLQRERDDASVKEARRIWVQGLEGDHAAADAAAASAAAAIAATNATAAAAAAAAAADDDPEQPSQSAAVSGGGGVLSFLDPPTSEAEAFAAAAITERYRLLGEEADARAARARWKRQRSARVVAARASLKVLYDEESHLWRGMAATAAAGAVGAAEAHGAPEDRLVIDGSACQVPETIAASPAAPPSRGSGSGDIGEENSRAAEEALAESEFKAAGDKDGGRMGAEEAEAGEAVGQEEDSVVPETPDKCEPPEDVKFSPVTIVDEPGGKSVDVSAALGGPADETPTIKFSHVSILQDPGGKSSGVSGALGGEIYSSSSVSVSGGDDAAASAGSLPGRSGVRRIMQEPGGNSDAVSRIMNRDAVDRMTAVETGAVDSAAVDPVLRTGIQCPGDDSPGLSPRAKEEVTVAAAAAAGMSNGGHGSSRSILQDTPSSGGPPHQKAAIVEGKRSNEEGAAPRHRREASGKSRNGWSLSADSRGNEQVVGGGAAGTRSSLPLEIIVRRCVREPVLAQCGAVDSAALAFLVRDAGVAEHLASLRTFLLGLTSDFLHDFTLRLLDGLYAGG